MQKLQNLLFSLTILVLLTLQVNAQSNQIDNEGYGDNVSQNNSFFIPPDSKAEIDDIATEEPEDYGKKGYIQDTPPIQNTSPIAEKNKLTIAEKMSSYTRHSDYQFELRNFPNPVVNQTTIVYTLEKNATVSLGIYDYAGNLVEQLRDKDQQYVATYQIQFDATGLKTGIYFCVLTMNNETKGIKILVQ